MLSSRLRWPLLVLLSSAFALPSTARGVIVSSFRKPGCTIGRSIYEVDGSSSYRTLPSPLVVGIANDAFRVLFGGFGPRLSLYAAPDMEFNAYFFYNVLTDAQGQAVGADVGVTYSPGWIDDVYRTWGPSAVLGLFAHETGHAMSWYFDWRQFNFESHDEERRADFLAGYAVARWRADPGGLEQVHKMFSTYDDGQHAAWPVRISDLRYGWLAGGGLPYW